MANFCKSNCAVTVTRFISGGQDVVGVNCVAFGGGIMNASMAIFLTPEQAAALRDTLTDALAFQAAPAADMKDAA